MTICVCKRRPPRTNRTTTFQCNQPIAAITSIFKPITAPILRAVDPASVTKLLKERARYKQDIKSKSPGYLSLQVLPYKARFNHELLDILVFMSKLESIVGDVGVNDRNNSRLEQYINEITKND